MSNITGVIVRGTRNIFLVLPIEKYELFLQQKDISPEQIYDNCIECRIKGKRGNIANSTVELNNFLMAGDRVYFEYIDNRYGVITGSVQRKNSLLRMRRDIHHCMAVNIDAVMSVFSVKKPEFNTTFFDKMVCLSLLEQLPMIAVINKIDLLFAEVPNDETSSASEEKNMNDSSFLQSLLPEPIRVRIDILSHYLPHMFHFSFTSIYSHQNEYLCNYNPISIEQYAYGNLVAVLGRSGVGKSSLLNALYPKLQRRVSALSVKYKEGRHTTTMPELCFCGGYAIVDTPGMRDMVPSQLPSASVFLAFPEFEQYAQQCKLPTCSHRDEPSCMVLPQVGKMILEQRYESYVKLRSEIEFHENKRKKFY